MKAHLLKAANEVILDQKMLVNVISRRVRQLSLGHRPLVEFAPGMGLADVALTEVIKDKLTYESTLGQNVNETATNVVPFAAPAGTKKQRKNWAASAKHAEFGVDRKARLGSLGNG